VSTRTRTKRESRTSRSCLDRPNIWEEVNNAQSISCRFIPLVFLIILAMSGSSSVQSGRTSPKTDVSFREPSSANSKSSSPSRPVKTRLSTPKSQTSKGKGPSKAKAKKSNKGHENSDEKEEEEQDTVAANVSETLLALHRWRTVYQFGREVDLLVSHQPCAVDAAKLEWLMDMDEDAKKKRSAKERPRVLGGHPRRPRPRHPPLTATEESRLRQLISDRNLTFGVNGFR
jgi:hypothetical protein